MRSSTLTCLAGAVAIGGVLLSGASCTEGLPTHTVFHGLDTAGMSGSAGAGDGSAGAGDGSAGTAGTAGTGNPSDAGITSGCGVPPDEPFDKFGPAHMIQVGARVRSYNVRLPPDYDPSTPYRVIYLGPGCGGDFTNTFQFNTVDMGKAILVTLNFLPGFERLCFDDQNADSFEYPYFDALHKEIEAKFCVDTKRQFFAGYSTGSWLANMLGCAFSDVLRAQGGVSGELPPLPTCKGPIAAMFIHDMMDTGNAYSGSIRARDRVLAINQCQGTATAPYNVGPNATVPAGSTCVQFTGCPAAYPVVFCTTMGQGHASQDALALGGLWNFFAKL